MKSNIDLNPQTLDRDQDFLIRSQNAQCINASRVDDTKPWYVNLRYMAAGVLFGIALVKSEVVSWFRIQEMFRLESFHMYGVIGVAVVVGIVSVFLIKKFNAKTIDGESIVFSKKRFIKGQLIGGFIFGTGWAITGACPGPLFAQMGMGFAVVGVTIVSAIAGTWVYGLLREKLP